MGSLRDAVRWHDRQIRRMTKRKDRPKGMVEGLEEKCTRCKEKDQGAYQHRGMFPNSEI